MKNMNDIEKQLAKGANNMHFEYKDAYWDSALATLKAAEKAKRRKVFFWFFFGLLFIGSTAFLLTYDFTGKTSTEIANTNNSSDNTITNNPADNNATNDNIEATNNNSSIENNTSNNEIADASIHNISDTDSGNNLTSKSNEASNNIGKSSAENQFSATNVTSTGANHTKASSNNATKQVNRNNAGTNSPTKTTAISTNLPSDSKNNIRKYIKLELLSVTELDKIELKDELAQPETTEELTIIIKEDNNKLSFVVNIGGVASKGYKNERIYFDLPYIGGEVYYQLNNKINISVGAGWYKKTGVGYIENYTSTTYGFGKKEKTTTVLFDEVYFAEIPVKINYAINPNHLIGVGATYSLILGSKNKTFSNETEFGSEGSFSSEIEPETIIPGFKDTYKSSQAIFVSYEYRYKRLGAEIRYHYGLNDITSEAIFNDEQIDRNSRVLFTLKYLLFK